MGDLEPITRNEKLWSGEDLTPVTRREMYIKHLYDETQVIPEYPVTREEMFILKAGEELHDVTIEQLTATENKTYSEEGVAYSPVIVNVPLPENAYLLKEIEDVEIASFNDGSDLPMPKLEVAIEPQQEGSGDPSPENIRPIIGWDEVNVTVADDTTDPTTENVYTIDLDGTRYGGKVDVISGVLTVDRAYFKYINVSTTSGTAVTDGWRCNFTCPTDDINRGKWSIQTGAIPIFNKISSVVKWYGANEYTVTLPNVTSKQEADAMLEGLEICYKLATPLTIQLTPTVVKSLRGKNNVWADTGNILDLSYLAKEE